MKLREAYFPEAKQLGRPVLKFIKFNGAFCPSVGPCVRPSVASKISGKARRYSEQNPKRFFNYERLR